MGVEVKQGARVLHVLRERNGGPVTCVEYRDEQGIHKVECAWLMDCSGQSAVIGTELGLREYDTQMTNYAPFGYWKGAKWIHEYVGHPDLTRIRIITTPRGWIRYIPMSRDIVGVGFVTHRQTLRRTPNNPEQLSSRRKPAACPEVQGIACQSASRPYCDGIRSGMSAAFRTGPIPVDRSVVPVGR